MEDFLKKNKKKTFLILFAIFIAWIFLFYIPKQKCISQITLGTSNYYYKPDGGLYDEKGFKTRNDALDYCMTYNSIIF